MCVGLGVTLLKDYQAKYSNYEKLRQELANAEKLFDLPITKYDDLIEVDQAMRNIAKVYELYEAQRVSFITLSESKNHKCMPQTQNRKSLM